MGGSSSKEKKIKGQYKKKSARKGGKKEKQEKAKWTKKEENVRLQHEHHQDSDVEDLQNPPVRGRSKSLRFCDFTQLDRLSKLDDGQLLPLDIAFFQDGRVQPEELCHVCGVYTGCETLTCGVCYRVFHEGCLAKIGQWSGPPSPDQARSMWSCHQCANLGNLLTEQEVIDVLKRLDKCGVRREDDLSLADYMAYCHLSLQEDEGKHLTREKAENARRRFHQVDTTGKGRITWCQFLNIETIRILNKRNKNALVRLLTKPEIERARDAFRILDHDKDGRITKATAHEALDRNSRRSGYYPDETMMYIDDDLNQSVSWIEFLRDRAIYIIAERPCLRASPTDHSTLRRGSVRSSLAAMSSLPISPQSLLSFPATGKVSKVRSMPTTPVSKLPPDAQGPLWNSSDNHGPEVAVAGSPTRKSCGKRGSGGSGDGHGSARSSWTHHSNKSSPTLPVSTSGFPLLPPPPSSARTSSHFQASRTSSSAANSPAKSTVDTGLRTSIGGQRGSIPFNGSCGNDVGCLQAASGRRSSGHTDLQDGSSQQPHTSLRTSHSESAGMGCSVTQQNQITGKPPAGNSAERYGRALAAPPYGKLVERVRSGEWHQNHELSLVKGDTSQVGQTFGHVTSDPNNLTGRRSLSLV